MLVTFTIQRTRKYICPWTKPIIWVVLTNLIGHFDQHVWLTTINQFIVWINQSLFRVYQLSTGLE